MQINYVGHEEIPEVFNQTKTSSVDFIILVLGSFPPEERHLDHLKNILTHCVRTLKEGGLLFVQGKPEYLPEFGVFLDQYLKFKYWIAIQSSVYQPTAGYPSIHAAILLFSKGNGQFRLNRVRFPHRFCAACGKSLRDWGGKSHLMNPAGVAISDVWSDLPAVNNYDRLSNAVLEILLKMVDYDLTDESEDGHVYLGGKTAQGIALPKEGFEAFEAPISEPVAQYFLPGFEPQKKLLNKTTAVDPQMWNVVHHGDAVEVLKRYPGNSIDLVFADPPYNLDKNYSNYEDEKGRNEYLDWCNTWLTEYIRILKPTGSLYLLNLPHWSMYHAVFLNRYLTFQNWIVWDALSEPRGKLMPAHYSLLFYTKHPTGFTINLNEIDRLDSRNYCLRAACIRRRKQKGDEKQENLTDIWWDIHRIKHRRDRDYHPCQLPDSLLERIIRISSNPGDVVLDALAGTGTTAAVAARLGRNYVAIDIDEAYVAIAKEKIAEVEQFGHVVRQSIPKQQRKFSKKALQLELRSLAEKLGRLPTPIDVANMSNYGIEVFLETFPTWGKALKAAKLEIRDERKSEDYISGSLG
jgi:DNA modification methylase